MKKHALLTVMMVLIGTMSYGQEFQGLKNFPDSVFWNLDYGAREDLSMRDHQLPIPPSWNVWERPANIKAKLALVKLQDLGLDKFSSMEELFAKAKAMGLVPCPAWAVVQIYLKTGYTGRGVWIPILETKIGEVPRIGCGGSHASTGGGGCVRPELFGGNPKEMTGGDIIVLMKM